ncbi:uncharacterized protein LOC121404776 [Drosophila obscura]|uniref:uncharacterized protein LOC121404776 n=1 Tax=Drosophila obscura TaxID=7282 RepID=UPI001BB26F12|nr:uncharacterized protein LOC121404776 [Drosophila obscura]
MDWECRACGEQIFISDPKNIFEKENSEILLRIKQLTGIPFEFDENLPTHICSCCLLDLNQAIVFRERCLKTHKRLQLKAAGARNPVQKDEPRDPLDETVPPTDGTDDEDAFSEEFSEPEDEKRHVLLAPQEPKEIKKIVPSPRSDYPRVVVKRCRMPEGTSATSTPAQVTPPSPPKRITSAKGSLADGACSTKKEEEKGYLLGEEICV